MKQVWYHVSSSATQQGRKCNCLTISSLTFSTNLQVCSIGIAFRSTYLLVKAALCDETPELGPQLGPQGAWVVDYGGGSGVLALAALHGGAALAVATDVDPLAVSACAANGRLNGFGGRLRSLECSRDVQVCGAFEIYPRATR